MFFYLVLEALVGIIAAIVIVVRVKKSENTVYGKLDRAGRITNLVLAGVYAFSAPFYMFLSMISDPDGEGILIVLGVLFSAIIASVSLICSLGLAFSVALRRKGKARLSFAVQFAGVGAILLALSLYAIFAGSLISTLN